MAKVHQIQFWLWLRPNPTGGACDVSQYPLVGWGRGTPDSFLSTPTAPRSLVRVSPLLLLQFKHWILYMEHMHDL